MVETIAQGMEQVELVSLQWLPRVVIPLGLELQLVPQPHSPVYLNSPIAPGELEVVEKESKRLFGVVFPAKVVFQLDEDRECPY
jgi:hypothetical protein